MSESIKRELQEIMADMNFHPTGILIKTMLDLYEQFGIIDSKILEVLNKRVKS